MGPVRLAAPLMVLLACSSGGSGGDHTDAAFCRALNHHAALADEASEILLDADEEAGAIVDPSEALPGEMTDRLDASLENLQDLGRNADDPRFVALIDHAEFGPGLYPQFGVRVGPEDGRHIIERCDELDASLTHPAAFAGE